MIVAVTIFLGLLFFSTAAGIVGHMYLNLDSSAGPAAPFTAVLMLFTPYIFFTSLHFHWWSSSICPIKSQQSACFSMHGNSHASWVPYSDNPFYIPNFVSIEGCGVELPLVLRSW